MATILEKAPVTTVSTGGGFKLKELFYSCIAHWQWFVISLIICFGAAYYYVAKTPPTYIRNASMMIKIDESGRSISANESMLSDLGISKGNTTILDELALLKSPDMMKDVVRRLDLNTTYTIPGRFRDFELYGSGLPVKATFIDLPEEAVASFDLTLNRDGKFTINNMTKNGKTFVRDDIHGEIGSAVPTPLGNIVITPSNTFNGQESYTMNVRRIPVKAMASGLMNGLNIELQEDTYDIINLSYTGPSAEKANDIIRELMAVYNDRWMRDKREQANTSSDFIEERISLLQRELGSVDNDISSFKSSHLIPDVNAAAEMYMSQASQANTALRDLRNQEYMAKYIRNYLANSENSTRMLPSSAGTLSNNLSTQIAQYNAKILERNSLVDKSSTSNPLVGELDAMLQALRQALISSIDNEIVGLNAQIRSQEGVSGQANSRIATNPQQAKYLLSVERQQKVKETLYLYLLQKREENELNQAISSNNTRIIREPDGPSAPIAPIRANIYLIALVTALLVPAAILYIREISVTVVRGRKDVKNLITPLAGELPFTGKTPKKFARKKNGSIPKIVVKENSRDSINEAFRVVRTNLEFMDGNNSKSRVIMMTSANPGSGKTFICYNLAKSFAVKNKKVICIDLDLRKASLSAYLKGNSFGIADYLANKVNDIEKIIQPVEDNANMSLIPVGTMPPNPTELLFSDRLRALVEDLRHHYDYVFIDCPPAEIVADSSIISKLADSSLFVIRAGLFRLDMLHIIDEYYRNGSYPNMSFILNGTVDPSNHYARRYGTYTYGYGYGYGYSYGSTYGSNTDYKEDKK